MPHGKPANTRCIQLDDNNLCKLFGKPERPEVCRQFKAAKDICGDSRDEALILLATLESDTG